MTGSTIEVLEQRVLLADGISPQGAPTLNGTVGVALSNVTVATFTITDPSGSPGTMWNALVEWGDGNEDKRIPATAGPDGTFEFVDSHTYATAGDFTITVMIAVPGSHMSGSNVVTTQADIAAPAPTLESISVTPANPSVAKGKTEPFTATGTFSDNSTENLTSQVTWASATASVATISAAGVATAVATGTSNISATSGGVTGSTVLTVTPAVLQSITVTPANPSLPKGETQPFTATGTFSDNSTENLTSQVTWASATSAVATITAAGVATGAATGTSNISATLDGVSGSTVLTVSAPVPQSIVVTPANPSVAKGKTEPFTATATLSDNSTQNVTSQVTWASATPAVATITAAGVATGVATGTSTISATLDGVSGSTVLTVTPAVLQSITVTPANPSVAKGSNEPFTATGILSDQSTEDLTGQVTWASATPSIANITAAGVATAVATGTSTISATSGGVTGTTVLTVIPAALQSIVVTPANPSVAAGETEPFTATGTFSDNSTEDITSQVTWTSGTASVATITAAGVATGVATGTSTISASLNGVTGSTMLTVTPAVLQSIAVTPANPSVAKGDTEPFTATGTLSDNSTEDLTSQVTWASATASVATITAAGVATAVATGTSTISATLDGISGTTVLTVTPAVLQSIAVTPVNPSVAEGDTEPFTATGTLSDDSTEDLTSQVTWASATASVATITAAGVATAVATGTSTISATLDGVTGTTVLTVTPAVLQSIAVTPANPTIAKGDTEPFTATGTFSDNSTEDLTSQVTWASATASVATISTVGVATAVATGTSTISATLDGVTGTTVLTVSPAVLQSIAVTPANPDIAKGDTKPFTATGTFSDDSTEDITNQVTWASATPSVATISSTGVATGVATGTSTISATFNDVTATTVLTVFPAALQSIAVTPANPSLPRGETQPFTATATFADNSTEDITSQVTWASATASVATITAAGVATGVATGTSTISATLDGVTGTTLLTVSPAVVQSITVTPANPSVPKGENETFHATGTLSDNSTEDLTGQVTWASATSTVATISTAGVATGVATGTSTISATLDGVTGSTTLTVSPAALVSIAVTPANPSVPAGESDPLTVTGTFSDNSTANVTGLVSFGATPQSEVAVTNMGVAIGLIPGPATITATLDGVSGSTMLTVSPAVLQSITVTPANPTLPKGETEPFTATGTFSDNSTEDLSGQVTWAAATPSVATISTTGVATGVAPGTSTITATLNGVSGSTVLTVSPAALLSIAVTPANPSINSGSTEPFTATGTFSDNSTEDLTGQVTWTSANTSVATVSTTGVATGVGAGSSAISATLDGVTGATLLTVTSPQPPPTPPQVVGSVAVSQSKKATTYTLTFNEPLNPAAANTPSLYGVFEGVTKVVKRKKETVYTKPLKIKTVSYNNSNHTVTITLAKPFKGKVQVTVASGLEAANGTSSSGSMMNVP